MVSRLFLFPQKTSRMRKRLLLLSILALVSVFVFSENRSYRTGYVGDEVKLQLSPEYANGFVELIGTSLNWTVMTNTSDNDAWKATRLIPSSTEKTEAKVIIDSYYDGTLVVQCRYEMRNPQNNNRSGYKYAYFEVTCNAITLTPDPRSIKMNVGDEPVRITYTPSRTYSPSGRKVNVYFSSDKPGVASVDSQTGRVTPNSEGTATITLNNDMGPNTTVSVTVEDPGPKKILLTASPSGGEVLAETKVYLSTTNVSGCDIYYTLNPHCSCIKIQC